MLRMFTLPVSQDEIKETDPKVIILSGGPESIYLEGSPTLPVPPHIPFYSRPARQSIVEAHDPALACSRLLPATAPLAAVM